MAAGSSYNDPMMKRWFLVSLSGVAAFVVAGGIALAVFLSSWVPTKGKALLIQELERSERVSVSIGTMRYDLFRGVQIENVRVIDRASKALWCSTPAMTIHVDWATLLLGRSLAFRASAPIEVPCQTHVAMAGRYQLRTHALVLDAQTTDIPLHSLAPVLRSHLPQALTDGMLRLTLHITQGSNQAPIIMGRLTGTHVVIETSTLHATGDVTLNGRVQLATTQKTPSTIDAVVSVRHATLTGPASLPPITNLQGTAHVKDDHLEINELTGIALGSMWKLEGRVVSWAHPSIDVLLTAHAELAPLIERLPPFANDWHLSGTSDLRVTCRGLLQPRLVLDCLAHADIREATLTGELLTNPLTHLAANLDYDHLTQRLSINRLETQIVGKHLSSRGEVVFSNPLTMSLNVKGDVPLDTLNKWLPTHGPITSIGGLATVDLQLEGPVQALETTGDIALHDAHIQFAVFPHTIDNLSGVIAFREERITTEQMSFRVNKQPARLTAEVTSSRPGHPVMPLDRPRLVATLAFPTAQLQLTSRLTPEAFLIDDSELSLHQSRVHIRGRIARAASRLSSLEVEGSVELSDLTELPLFSLPSLELWKLQGISVIEAAFDGPLSDWHNAILRGRLSANHLSIREIPLDQLSARIEQHDRTLRLQVPSSLIAEGTCSGELTIEHHPHTHDYVLQTDLIGLQLERLAHMIPAWRSRSVTGSASAHAIVSGTWEQQPTWHGEGWVHAAGERLADIPLLDKLFRGLFGVLGDRLGLESLRRAEITRASVQWHLRDERFTADDLRLWGAAGTEPVTIYAKGSVGLDQTVDFIIEPELSEGAVLQAPSTSSLASTVFKAAGQLERFRRLIGRHHLTGTLKTPQYHFELTTQEILKQLAPAPADFLQGIFDAVR